MEKIIWPWKSRFPQEQYTNMYRYMSISPSLHSTGCGRTFQLTNFLCSRTLHVNDIIIISTHCRKELISRLPCHFFFNVTQGGKMLKMYPRICPGNLENQQNLETDNANAKNIYRMLFKKDTHAYGSHRSPEKQFPPINTLTFAILLLPPLGKGRFCRTRRKCEKFTTTKTTTDKL